MKSPVLLLAVLLCACQPKPLLKVDAPPQIVRVPVPTYVRIPAELDAACYDEPAKEQSYGEALRLANLRAASIAECNERAAKRRALQNKARTK